MKIFRTAWLGSNFTGSYEKKKKKRNSAKNSVFGYF